MRHEIIDANGDEFVLPIDMDVSNCLVFVNGKLMSEIRYTLLRESNEPILEDGKLVAGRQVLYLNKFAEGVDIIVVSL